MVSLGRARVRVRVRVRAGYLNPNPNHSAPPPPLPIAASILVPEFIIPIPLFLISSHALTFSP